MQIYVARAEQKLGPYTLDEVRSKLASGELSESDLAWHEGLTNWLPLQQVLASFSIGPAAPPLLPAKRSGLAMASFIIAMGGIGVWGVILMAAAGGVNSGATAQSPLMIIVGLFFIAGVAANLVGTILGIIALKKPLSNKWMAITGLVVNLVELFVLMALIVVGLAAKSQ